MQQYKVAVLGATGAVGETILSILAARQFPVKELFPLASTRSAGEVIDFNNKPVRVLNADDFDFRQADIALFSAGGAVSQRFAPIATEAGCVVIDNTSCFRYDPEVPLVVPEVNDHAIADYRRKNIIANPNCSTIQMLLALAPIHRAVGIKRINVATYQAVSGSGKSAIEELAKQTVALLGGQSYPAAVYPKQIAFNVIPHIDAFLENGYTKEEMKMVWETQKILDAQDILVNPTAVRVPVFYGHSEAVHLETHKKISVADVRALLEVAPGVRVIDDPESGAYPTPVTDASGQDEVAVGRIRADISDEHGINLWVVADNIRKGAALNAVQIAESLIKNYF